jgi:hypothetical protein
MRSKALTILLVTTGIITLTACIKTTQSNTTDDTVTKIESTEKDQTEQSTEVESTQEQNISTPEEENSTTKETNPSLEETSTDESTNTTEESITNPYLSTTTTVSDQYTGGLTTYVFSINSDGDYFVQQLISNGSDTDTAARSLEIQFYGEDLQEAINLIIDTINTADTLGSTEAYELITTDITRTLWSYETGLKSIDEILEITDLPVDLTGITYEDEQLLEIIKQAYIPKWNSVLGIG